MTGAWEKTTRAPCTYPLFDRTVRKLVNSAPFDNHPPEKRDSGKQLPHAYRTQPHGPHDDQVHQIFGNARLIKNFLSGRGCFFPFGYSMTNVSFSAKRDHSTHPVCPAESLPWPKQAHPARQLK